jgi:hypothetical protein
MREDHISTNQEAIDTINGLFEMNGYKEGKGDLWLGGTLDRLKEFLGDPRPFARHEMNDNGDDRDYNHAEAEQCAITGLRDAGVPGFETDCPNCRCSFPARELRHDLHGTIVCAHCAAGADVAEAKVVYQRTPEAIADAVRRADSHIKQITPNVIEIGE